MISISLYDHLDVPSLILQIGYTTYTYICMFLYVFRAFRRVAGANQLPSDVGVNKRQKMLNNIRPQKISIFFCTVRS